MTYLTRDSSNPKQIFELSDGSKNTLEGIWPNRYYSDIQKLELHYFATKEVKRAQALVYGGGGYRELVYDKEGVEIARWLNSIGIDAYVVIHRLPGCNNHAGGLFPADIALQDGLICLDFLDSRGNTPLLHVGLSSGGHLAGVMACQPNNQQTKGAIIAYAPINANHSRYKAPKGKPDYPPIEKQEFYNQWPIGISAEPHGIPAIPVFLTYGLHDPIVPIDHALNLIKTGQEKNIDIEAHIYPSAPHGFALRDVDGPHHMWPILAQTWIDNLLS